MAVRTADRMWALDGGRLYMATADIMEGGSGVQELVVPTFLIEHGDALVLVDTGLNPAAEGNEEAVYGHLRPFAITRFDEGRSVPAQLARIGKRPSEVTHVIVSHAHFDHTGGLGAFPNATVVIGAREWEHIVSVLAGDVADDVLRAADFTGVAARDKVLVSADMDLFGDGAIALLSLPGHTIGNLSVLVRLPSRTVLLTADTAHLQAQWVDQLPMPIDMDRTQAIASMQRAHDVALAVGADVWVGHDLGDWIRNEAPGEYR